MLMRKMACSKIASAEKMPCLTPFCVFFFPSKVFIKNAPFFCALLMRSAAFFTNAVDGCYSFIRTFWYRKNV